MLDSYPLGALFNPKPVVGIVQWSKDCESAGHKIYVPEVIDYELRRELLRAKKSTSIARLDRLTALLRFLPINSAAMLLAAELWTRSRMNGLPTGDPKRLDVDVMLAAQALAIGLPTANLVIATSNVGHLSRFAPAKEWQDINP